MNQNVSNAVEEIRAAFPTVTCQVVEDGEGGAFVTLEAAEIGEIYEPSSSWVGFRITFQYPYADVYPHFVRHDLRRRDGRPLGEAINPGQQFQGWPSVMLSRKSNRLNPTTDTALLKLQKVLTWLSTRP